MFMRRFLPLLGFSLFILLGAMKICEWASEFLWFGSLGFTPNFQLFFAWRTGSFALVFALWAALLSFNARCAWNNSQFAPAPLLGAKSRLVAATPTRNWTRGLFNFGVLTLAFLAGLAASQRFDLWIGAFHTPFSLGERTPSFFLFVWPALQSVWNFVGAALLATFALCAAIYLWEESVEIGARGSHITRGAARHLGVLAALLTLWIGGRALLSFWGAPIVFGWSPNGIFGPTEQSFAQPTRLFFAVSAPLVAIWLLFHIWRDGRAFAWIGTMIWALCAGLFPLLAAPFGRALGSRSPDSARQQRAAIQAHLSQTRRAWGLEVVSKTIAPGAGDWAELPKSNLASNANLWPRATLRRVLNDRSGHSARRIVEVFPFASKNGVGWRGVAQNFAARDDFPGELWQAAPSKTGDLQAQIAARFGALLLSGAARDDVARADFSNATSAPLPLAPNFWRRTQSLVAVEISRGSAPALALRFWAPELLRAGAPISWHLDPLDRAATLAPFVNWNGAQAQPVVTRQSGQTQLLWAIVGCFSSRTFAGAASLPASDGWNGVNYARQNVIALCNASTGATTFHLLDENQAHARLWKRLLPEFFRPSSEISTDVRAQIEPSRAFLNAQAVIWSRYHTSNGDAAQIWSARSEEWPILAPDSTQRGFWQSAPNGLVCAFAPTPKSQGRAAQISAILGVTRDGLWDGRAPTSWRGEKALDLPAWVRDDGPRLGNNRLLAPTPTRLSLEPTLSASGDIVGLQITRAQTIQSEKTPNLWDFQAQSAISQFLAPIEPSNGASKAQIERAKALWKAILGARRAGDWEAVERLETQLGAVLKSELTSPSKTPANPNAQSGFLKDGKP